MMIAVRWCPFSYREKRICPISHTVRTVLATEGISHRHSDAARITTRVLNVVVDEVLAKLRTKKNSVRNIEADGEAHIAHEVTTTVVVLTTIEAAIVERCIEVRRDPAQSA